tara:strand:+ start:383 stop:619 length:237 start_codon:yes stop_codon:yes gene_type:complete
MAIKVVSGNTQVKRVTLGSPVRIVHRVQGSEFTLGQLGGVNITGVSDGATLIYNGTSENFESKVEISNTNTTFNGGNF